jgi:hypothetical protein
MTDDEPSGPADGFAGPSGRGIARGTLPARAVAPALLWKDATREDLTMATHDSALARAARAHGLPVIGVKR